MNTQFHPAHTTRSRRARAVYASQRTCGPVASLIAAQLGLLAVMTLAVAGIVGLRVWLSG